MNQKDKQLILQDLCTRLPYKVIIQVKDWVTVDAELKIGHINRLQIDDVELKPYLRPMSDMTKEERAEYRSYCDNYYGFYFDTVASIDWLNAHHFDYRGLIEKDLAIEVKEENNPYKD